MGIKLIVDSSADLPQELIERYNIGVVPLSVHFGDEAYLDKFEIDSHTFYEKLAGSAEIPTTSQVTPERFKNAFEEALKKGDDVICITIGSNASGTCQSANIAKNELEEEARIDIVDSNGLCMGTGYIAIVAAMMLEEGKSKEEVITEAKRLAENRIEHLFCVDTLEYLKKGGRIKPGQAMIAALLNIKPILDVEDAITQTLSKVRGRKKVIPFYIEKMKKDLDVEGSPFISVAHSQDREFADEFIDRLRQDLSWEKPVYVSEIGAVIGTHAGPGVLAVFYVKK